MNATKPEMLAVEIARGQPIADAARAAGLSPRTAYRLMAEPGFRARVDELRRAMVQTAVGKLTDSATEATDTLRTLLGAGHPPTVRLGAARAILDNVVDLQTHADILERIAALERREHAREGGEADPDA